MSNLHPIHARAWLLLPAVMVCAADGYLTLTGQPADYWQDHGQAVEANPLAYPFLAWSPWAFVALGLVWGVAFGSVVLLWRHPAGGWLAVGVTVGHAFAGACWLAGPGAVGWVFAVLYLVAVALGVRWCWRRARNAPET